MKQYRLNFEKIKIYVIIIAFLALGLYVFNTLKNFSSSANEKKADTSADIVLNGNGEYSNGYDHGTVYSIDGQAISADTEITAGENKYMRHCGIPEFTPVLGIEGFGENGLINKLDITLHSSAKKANIDKRKGNNIQTTFSYNGQITASSLLKYYFPLSICDGGASLAIVLKDGTVIVAAGSNAYQADFFDLNDEKTPEDICVDKSAENYAVGSVAKGITSATLLLNDKNISDREYSLYNPQFEDVSFFSHGGHTIHNHDCYISAAYETVSDDGVLIRRIGLNQALVCSSNTYFWRHALNFGLDRTFNAMDEIFGITAPIRTEINTLNPVEVEKDRLDYFFWGQDFNTSPVRLCSMYNFALSGEKYSPFYITSVRTPDDVEVYRAKPQPTKTFKDDNMKKFLREGLAKCFKSYSQYMDFSVYGAYTQLIDDNRILSKSGTADVIENEITNHSRILTVLDENHDVVCTACIAVKRATNKCTVNDNILFDIMFKTLEASGIL